MPTAPPPPPPRPSPPALNSFDTNVQMMGTQFLGGMQPPFMGMTPSYGMYDPYNRMGTYGTGLAGYNSPESNFVRMAEESSRNAFQSIESVVSAVTSVANMLNSTHAAVFSSFRAVLGLVEQIRSMRQQTSYAFLAFFHFIRFLWRRILSWLRLRPRNYANSENIWTSLIDKTQDGSSTPTLNWPTLFFWVIAIGGPYLIYRCVSNMIKAAEDSRKWAVGEVEHYTAQALYDFDASSNQELSFRAYDMLRVAPKAQQPKVRDWLLASSVDGERIGLVPINYIKLINRNPTNSPPQSTSQFIPENPKSQQHAITQNSSTSSIYDNAFSTAWKNLPSQQTE